MHSCLKYIMLLILTIIGFGCQSSSQKNLAHAPEQVVRVNIRDEPQTLDPRKARHLNSQVIVHMLFDGLTRANKEGKEELALTDHVDISSDLKTYTFHLKDAFWTNGDPVTAVDFAYSWKKTLSPDFPSDTAFQLYVIKNAKSVREGKMPVDQAGIRVVDEKTLIVELENPTPYFLQLVGTAAFFPVNKNVDELNPQWTQDASSYVCNGPFKLIEWKHQDQLVIEKNEQYWDAPNVQLAAVKLHMLNEETELKMFEKKELDWAGSPLSILPLDALKDLKKDNQLKTARALGTYFLRTNTQFRPLSHPLMRKAFALAINRQAIVEHVTQGNQLPATGLVPLSFGLQNEPYFQDGDVATAKQLFEQGLKELHLTKETLPEICYLYRMNERNHLIAQAIQQQWFEAFGIRVKLEGIEAKVFFSRVSKQDFHFAYGDWSADFADPINFLEVFKYKKSGTNNTHWENAQYAKLLERSSQILDQKERFELLAQSERILIDEMPIIPVLYSNMLYLSQPALKGVSLSSMGTIDFKWARLSEAEDKMIVQGDKR